MPIDIPTIKDEPFTTAIAHWMAVTKLAMEDPAQADTLRAFAMDGLREVAEKMGVTIDPATVTQRVREHDPVFDEESGKFIARNLQMIYSEAEVEMTQLEYCEMRIAESKRNRAECKMLSENWWFYTKVLISWQFGRDVVAAHHGVAL